MEKGPQLGSQKNARVRQKRTVLETIVQPPTKRINISTRQSGLWDCKQKKKETNSVLRTQRPSAGGGPDSTPNNMRPSEETGLNALII